MEIRKNFVWFEFFLLITIMIEASLAHSIQLVTEKLSIGIFDSLI